MSASTRTSRYAAAAKRCMARPSFFLTVILLFNIGVNTGETYQESEDKSISIGFELSDSDPEDYFSVNVREDPIYRTPVFQLVSGATQNPWERGFLEARVSGCRPSIRGTDFAVEA